MSTAPAAPRPSRTYLDYAASAPIRPEVAEQIAADLRDPTVGWVNPAALHGGARKAGALLAEARSRLAAAIDADPHEVLFTSGGTEADALAVVGRALAMQDVGPQLVISPIEHPAMADSAQVAQRFGATVTTLTVDAAGRVNPESLRSSLQPGRTALVSIMAANNETGVIQDLAGLIGIVRESSGEARPGSPEWIAVHTDAVAALGKMPLSFASLGLDAMSIAGHKIGAPVGVGALVARRDLSLVPPTGGGRQERGIRSGTQDVIAARALALAVELAVSEREAEEARLERLRSRLVDGATQLPGLRATLTEDVPHLASTAHFYCEDADVEALLMSLDMHGIDISSGSACHAGVSQPSTVMLAMGFDDLLARQTLRCSMGAGTSVEDIDRLLTVLPSALEVARAAWKAKHGR